MPTFTEQLIQKIALPANCLPPANYAAGVQTIGPVDMSRFQRAMLHFTTGVMGANTNVQGFFQCSNTATGTFSNINTGVQASSSTAPSQLTAAVSTLITNANANSENKIEIRADQLPPGNRYLKGLISINTNAAFVAASLECGDPSYSPAAQYDNSNSGNATAGVLNPWATGGVQSAVAT